MVSPLPALAPPAAAGTLSPIVSRFGQLHGLSRRQCLLVELAATGIGRKESALRVGSSIKTVEEHWRRIYQKTGASSPIEVLAQLIQFVLDPNAPLSSPPR